MLKQLKPVIQSELKSLKDNIQAEIMSIKDGQSDQIQTDKKLQDKIEEMRCNHHADVMKLREA